MAIVESNTQTRDINITVVNDAPVIAAIEGDALVYTENDPALAITSTLTVTDMDDEDIESAIVAIDASNYVEGEDVLAFATQGTISGTWNATTGELALTGTATKAQYETALRSVTYENTSDDPSEAMRTVSFTVSDDDSESNTQTRDIDITVVNDAPAIAAIETDALVYTENDPAVAITSTLTIDDLDDEDIESAVVAIDASNYVEGEDVLAFATQGTISGTWNATTGELALTGTATKAQYETALRSVTYENTSDDPSETMRTVSFSVSDDDSESNTQIRDINITVVNDAPVIAAIEADAVTYTENDTAIAITSMLTVTDLDDETIESAVVAIGASDYVEGEDVLAFATQGNISGTWNSTTGELVLSGIATKAQYETALRSVTYENTSDDSSALTRTVSFTVSDGESESNTQTRDINITVVNDAPVIAAIEADALVYTENDPAVAVTSTLTIDDLDDEDIGSAVVAIDASDYVEGEDVLAFATQGTISGTWNATTGELVLTGIATKAQYETALRSVTYENTSDDPSALTRAVSFTVSDGDSESNTQTRDINITAVNDAPATTVPATVTVAEETSTTLTGVSVADVDAVDGDITTRLQVTDGVLNIAPGSANIITGTNNSADITLSGSVSEINAMLASLNYTGNTDVTGIAADTLTITTNDNGNTGSGGALIDSASIQIDILAVNDSPVVTAPVNAYEVDEQTSLAIHGTGFTVSDIDAANDILSATLTVEEGTLSVVGGNSGISISSGNASESVVVTGTLSQIDNLLTGASNGTIAYSNNSDTPAESTRLILTVNDGSQVGADQNANNDTEAEQNSASQIIRIIPINDSPFNSGSLPTDIAVIEDVISNLDLSLIEITDVDAASGNLTVSLNTVNGGNLTASNAPGVTVSANDSTVSITGSLQQINNYLDNPGNIKYLHGQENTEGNNADLLRLSIDDNGNTGINSEGQIDLGSINIDIGSINDAPTVAVPSVQIVQEDVLKQIAGIRIADSEAGPANVSMALSVTNGTLAITPVGTTSITSGFNESRAMTLTGQISDINASLESLFYQGRLDFNGEDVLQILATDIGNLSAAASVDIVVEPVNDILEGQPVIQGLAIRLNVLTVDVSSVIDVDGQGEFTYQWFRNDNEIAGATDSTYELTGSDAGTLISVSVGYLDSQGELVEFVLSDQRPVIIPGTIDVVEIASETNEKTSENSSQKSTDETTPETVISEFEEEATAPSDRVEQYPSDFSTFFETIGEFGQQFTTSLQDSVSGVDSTDSEIEILASQISTKPFVTSISLPLSDPLLAEANPLQSSSEFKLAVESSHDSTTDEANAKRQYEEQSEQAELLRKNIVVALFTRPEVITGVGLSLLTGVISWSLSVSGIALTFLSNLPVWRFFDPMPIFVERDKSGNIGSSVRDSMGITSSAEESDAPGSSTETQIENLFDEKRTKR